MDKLRSPLRSAVLSAIVCVLAAAGAAVGQPAFSPALDSPTPIESPISFELQPGAAAECVGAQIVEGAPLPVPPETRIRIVVEDAGGAVRIRLVDLSGAGVEIAMLVGANGEVSLDESSGLGAASEVERQVLAAVPALLPELQLHRRTLVQDDPLYDPGELERIFGQMFSAMAGPGMSPEVSGGSYLRGETELEGRRLAVFAGAIELAEPSIGMRVVVNAVEVYDIETGLRAYGETTIRIPTPPGVDVPEVTIRQNIACTLSRS